MLPRLAWRSSMRELQNGGIEAIGLAVIRGAFLSLTFLGLRVAYRALRKRDGIGFGDVKLAGVAGAWLGWQTMPIAVQIAALAALITYAIRRYVAGTRPADDTSPPLRSFFRTGNMAGLANASTGVGTVLSPICIGGKAWSDDEKNRQDRVGRGCNSPDSKCARPRGTPLGRHRRLHQRQSCRSSKSSPIACRTGRCTGPSTAWLHV